MHYYKALKILTPMLYAGVCYIFFQSLKDTGSHAPRGRLAPKSTPSFPIRHRQKTHQTQSVILNRNPAVIAPGLKIKA